MSYVEVINKYDNTNYRVLMMKLSIENSFTTLLSKMNELPATYSVADLFSEMKGDWEIKCGPQGNRVYDEKIYNNVTCRNSAVLFAIRILGPELTLSDRKHMYNCYRFIQSHPYVFGDRIRYHIREVVFEKLTLKQQTRESKFKLNICNNESDTDTDSSESGSEDECYN